MKLFNYLHFIFSIATFILAIMLLTRLNNNNKKCIGDSNREHFANPKTLSDLNNWARDNISSKLNNYCTHKDYIGEDLRVGQYCTANCAEDNNSWKPGGKIVRTNSGFKWQKDHKNNPNYYVNNYLPDTKRGYCEYVKQKR